MHLGPHGLFPRRQGDDPQVEVEVGDNFSLTIGEVVIPPNALDQIADQLHSLSREWHKATAPKIDYERRQELEQSFDGPIPPHRYAKGD